MKFKPPKMTLQELAAAQATQDKSITVLKELTPIRCATQRPLPDGAQWSGTKLTRHKVTTSLFGGPHYRISLYSNRMVPDGTVLSDGVPTIPVFVIRWSCTNEQMYDEAFHAQVDATGAAYLDLLNMRRVP